MIKAMYFAHERSYDPLIFVFEIDSARVWRGNFDVVDANRCLVGCKSFGFQMCG